MTLSATESLPPIEQYRSYLHVLARAQLHPRVQPKLDASDIVQQTLLEAHRDRDAFAGSNAAQLAGWLRGILAHNLDNALRDLRRKKRDIRRERPIDGGGPDDAAIDRSGLDTPSWLADDSASPSEILEGHERLLSLSAGMTHLPEDQAQAIVLRYWQNRPLADIADRMERTPAAVAGLLHRGLKQLRELLAELESS